MRAHVDGLPVGCSLHRLHSCCSLQEELQSAADIVLRAISFLMQVILTIADLFFRTTYTKVELLNASC